MKKITVFILTLGLVMGSFAQVNSLRTMKKGEGIRTLSATEILKIPHKVVNNTKDPIPAGYARVSLYAEDIYGDGTGFQLLLDADHNTYGTLITGHITGNVPASTYAQFEYTLPANADGNLLTTNVILNTTATVDVLAGTYDWFVFNPDNASGTMYITTYANDYVFVDGHSYALNVTTSGIYIALDHDAAVANLVLPESGSLGTAENVEVTVYNIGQEDLTNLTVNILVNGTSIGTENIASLSSMDYQSVAMGADFSTVGTYIVTAFVTAANDADRSNDTISGTVICTPPVAVQWDFQDNAIPAGFVIVDLDRNTINSNIAALYPTPWAVNTVSGTNKYFASAASWFTPVSTADRWLISSLVTLLGGNSIYFERGSMDPDYLESMEYRISNGSDNTDDFTLLEAEAQVPARDANYVMQGKTIDLANYAGQTVRFAWRLTSNDCFRVMLDNIRIFGDVNSLNTVNNVEVGVYPNPVSNELNINTASKINSVELFNAMGQKVYQGTDNKINVADFANGIYSLRISTNEGISTKQVSIIKR